MTNRCITGGKHQQRFKSYENTTHSELFSNFDTWYEWALTKEGFMCVDDKGFLYQLDKDILGGGSVYSEDSCCFVPPYINGYMNSFKKFPNFKRDKEFFASVYDSEFSTLDERVLEKFFEISKFNYSLDKEDRRTEKEQEEYLNSKQIKFRMDLEINKILFVKDDIDVMTGVVFTNGCYKVPSHIVPEGLDFKNSFDDVLDCVICKFNFRISKVVNIFNNLSSGVEYDFINSNRYDDCVNKIESLRSTLDKIILDKIISGEVRLKKWVLVDR